MWRIPTRKLFQLLSYTKLLVALNTFLIVFLFVRLFSKRSLEFVNQHEQVLSYDQLAQETMQVFEFVKNQQNGKIPTKHLIIYSKIQIPWCWSSIQQKPDQNQINRLRENLWQTVDDLSIDLFLYSAYWDTRPDERTPQSIGFVRILGMAWKSVNQKLFCHMWWSNGRHFAVEAHILQIWEKSWDPRDTFYYPYLISCPLPKSNFASSSPEYVSLTLNACRTNFSNILPVRDNAFLDSKKDVVVCVKGIFKF